MVAGKLFRYSPIIVIDDWTDAPLMTKDDLELIKNKRKVNYAEILNIPLGDNTINDFNECFPMNLNKVMDAYCNGVRYKQYRNMIKREQKKKMKSKIDSGKFIVTFD